MTDIRKQFEDWLLTKHANGNLTRRGEGYMSPFVDGLWMAWQASREAILIELPSCTNDSQDTYFRELEDRLLTAGVNYR